MQTPNIFTIYTTHANEYHGGRAPKWQPVNTTKVTLESGEMLILHKQAVIFTLGGDLQLKAVTHAVYHTPTNTIYYYAPDKKRGRPAKAD